MFLRKVYVPTIPHGTITEKTKSEHSVQVYRLQPAATLKFKTATFFILYRLIVMKLTTILIN
jgi:hypothetical protein